MKAASWLVAWDLMGMKCTNHEKHIDVVVPAALVAKVRAEIEKELS